MADQHKKINGLLVRIEKLSNRQALFSAEINELRKEVNRLKSTSEIEEIEEKSTKGKLVEERPVEQKRPAETIKPKDLKVLETPTTSKNEADFSQPKPPPLRKQKSLKKSDWEKFVGENLINKIGIAILVIGVGIGAKYAMDNELISPLTRIVLGYLAGLGLLATAFKLRKNYENFSAVLLSGAMAVLYFITYFGYSLYALIPLTLAFVLMVALTVFTVTAAISYKQQIIAIIGLVGAYAVPFLLSTGSGNVLILFSYMTIINIGILVVSFKKYWKHLFYVAFFLTWLIFASWYLFNYDSYYLNTVLWFSSAFFVQFYVTFLAYKLLRKQKFTIGDIILLTINSFIFYGLGYALIGKLEYGNELLGAFTLANAAIHFIVGFVIYRKKLADKSIFYFVSGLVLVFITIAIPVQLDGNWVTLLWAALGVLLFVIGSRQEIPFYRKLAYPLIGLTFISLLMDWSEGYGFAYTLNSDSSLTPFINHYFLTSLLVSAAFGAILIIHQKMVKVGKTQKNNWAVAVGILFLFTLYFSFYLEISNYFQQLYLASKVKMNDGNSTYPNIKQDYDLLRYQSIWLINYTLVFFTLLSLFTMKKLKNELFGVFNLACNVLVLFYFLTAGLYGLSELRESYLTQSLAEYYHRGIFNILIRYVSIALVGVFLIVMYRYIRQNFIKTNFRKAFDFLLQLTILWILSSELLNWLDIFGVPGTYKLGLSIFWGIFSLWLIVFGLWKNKKHLRIGAIILFGVTLLKLFFYDISFLDTISKTIVFVALGILLLLISFLYNKYKHLVTDD